VEARRRAREAANAELRSIVKAWNDVFAVEAFFVELDRRAETAMWTGDLREDRGAGV
jgi:hypothetical protein